MTFSRLSTVIIYSTSHRLSILIAYNISYKWFLDFGIPGVLEAVRPGVTTYNRKVHVGFSGATCYHRIGFTFFRKFADASENGLLRISVCRGRWTLNSACITTQNNAPLDIKNENSCNLDCRNST